VCVMSTHKITGPISSEAIIHPSHVHLNDNPQALKRTEMQLCHTAHCHDLHSIATSDGIRKGIWWMVDNYRLWLPRSPSMNLVITNCGGHYTMEFMLAIPFSKQ
jgi:hypothetical protein